MPRAKSRPAAPKTSRVASAASSEAQVASFLDKYTSEAAADAKHTRARMRMRVPGGIEFVYDNYNALVFGFGPTERPSDAVLSLAVFPEWVTLCFLKGAKLPDPKKLLKGSGNVVRNIRLSSPSRLDDPDVAALVSAAIAAAVPAFPRAGKEPSTVIKSISAKQRPRRPGQPGARRSK